MFVCMCVYLLVCLLHWMQVFELRSAEELTEDWLKQKLGFFR